MATKYDVFELIYENRAPMKPIEVVKKLKKGEEDYHNIHKLLRSLVKDRILIKVKDGFEIKITPKTELLYKLIYYCTHNGINYNLLLDKNIANFIYESLKKEEFQQKYIKVNPKTFKKYIEILDKFGLILISSKKPLKARIFDNALINNLLNIF